MSSRAKVAVLLATYNGEKYIREQLDSIINQSMQEFVCYIRDDDSVDGTKKILDEYCKKYPRHFKLICTESNRHGALNNFVELSKYVLKHTIEPFIMFCDQDDVWNNDKIELQYQYIKNEAKDIPMLVYCDQVIVDEKLKVIAESNEFLLKREDKDRTLKRLVFRNVAAGCAICINRCLLEIAFQNVSVNDIVMHDWWLMLVAASFGEIRYINKSLMLYRQHGNNSLGVDNSFWLKKIRKYFFDFKGSVSSRKKQTELCIHQMKQLNKLNIQSKNKLVIERFSQICSKPKIYRSILLVKDGYIAKNNLFTCFFV